MLRNLAVFDAGSVLRTTARVLTILCLISGLGVLQACHGKKSDDEAGADQTERQYYERAQRSLRASNFDDAIQRLQQLESRYPFGRYAEQAQLELIYAYFKSVQPESARSAADRFIRLHPEHPNVDYAYYLRGMASFEEDRNVLDRYLPLDPAKRDPGAARDSFNDFAQLISRFPDSKYAPDAQMRMIYLRNMLAAHEIYVARYYIIRGAYLAAINRGRYVLENFQQTPSVADGLAIMVEAYLKLGLKQQADETLKVLVLNYPDHPTLDKEGHFLPGESVSNSEKSWLNIITFGLFG